MFVVGPDLHHLARHLVAQDAGGGEGDGPADDVQVGVTHSAGGDLDQYLAVPGPRGADGFHLHAVGDVSQDGGSHRLGDGRGHGDHSSFATSRQGFEKCYARHHEMSRQIGVLFALNARDAHLSTPPAPRAPPRPNRNASPAGERLRCSAGGRRQGWRSRREGQHSATGPATRGATGRRTGGPTLTNPRWCDPSPPGRRASGRRRPRRRRPRRSRRPPSRRPRTGRAARRSAPTR